MRRDIAGSRPVSSRAAGPVAAALVVVTMGPRGVHLALGDEHDPVFEIRAPTPAIATKLATTVTPRLTALG
jgi:hypothetical protein